MLLIDPGILPPKLVEKAISDNSNVLLITASQASVKKYGLLNSNIPIVLYPKSSPVNAGHSDIASVWSEIVNDHQTWMLYDREPGYFRLAKSAEIENIIVLSEAARWFLLDNNVKAYLTDATPHNLNEWIFARTAELLGISVYYFQSCPIPWRVWLHRGLLASPKIIPPSGENSNGPDEEDLTDYISSKKGDSSVSLPYYELERLKSNNNKYYNFNKDLMTYWRRPDLVINKLLRFREYRRRSNGFAWPKKCITFFLHFQPERTTLPEGYGFASQFAAIHTLRRILPEDVELIVKEHPSTFTLICSPKFRYKSFYKNISLLGGVSWAPLEIDARELIDRSVAISSITGTVAGEALLRGKPAVLFGGGPIQNYHGPGFHRYRSEESLSIFLASLTKDSDTDISLGFQNYLFNIRELTYCGLEAGRDMPVSTLDWENVRAAANVKAFKEFLQIHQSHCHVTLK